MTKQLMQGQVKGFEIGDIVKFSEEGLMKYYQPKFIGKRIEEARKRRWIIVGFSEEYGCGSLDSKGNMRFCSCLRLKRLDKPNSQRIESWSPDWFEDEQSIQNR